MLCYINSRLTYILRTLCCAMVGSYLPWFDLFFRLLNYISNIISCCTDNTELHHIELLLEQLMSADVSKPSAHVDVAPPTSGLVRSVYVA